MPMLTFADHREQYRMMAKILDIIISQERKRVRGDEYWLQEMFLMDKFSVRTFTYVAASLQFFSGCIHASVLVNVQSKQG